jgi:hypothetical protein
MEAFCDPIQVLENLNMTEVRPDSLLSTTVVCTENNLSCDLQGEAVLLNLQSGIYFGLNPLGARIWELIQKPIKVGDILQELLMEYNVDASQCEADLLSFLKLLESHRLMRALASAPPQAKCSD